MTLVHRVLFAAAFVVGLSGPAAAATLAIAWDPTSDSRLSGYRVYVGTSPGVHTESFDVSSFQTSFYYTKAVTGQRYYFAVATLIPGAVSGKSAEVSAVATALTSVAGAALPLAQSVLPRSSHAQPGPVERGIMPAAGAITEIGSGLPEVTVMAALPAGRGLLVLEAANIRVFSDAGVGDLAHASERGTRIAALAVDPQFEATGLVYVVEARLDPGGEDISVVRHRLLAGVLGESAVVVSAGRQPPGTAIGLATTADGEIILGQGQRLTVFRQDGSIVRSQPMTSGGAGPGVTSTLAWDGRRGGVWNVGSGAASAVEASFVSVRDGATTRTAIVEPGDGSAVTAGVAMLDAAAIAVASATTVFRFDPATSWLSTGTPISAFGTVVSLVPASPAEDLVVVREPALNQSGHVSYSLLRVRHADLP